ncbi:LOW QUALITY PROTEIN: hypothetical protein BC937DRAFT_95498 [Endogone sp. FLAS-F59071]|nr:LOW QUALITY PROTEIN: hypothetical protein BC937DRAFT_95498 [Endogone sp. FLAS-F59071]|eukprot:RUS13323.1 LOW QUALITY PROTEIN: hypothetical protein BC937DRAFT_95498 [Endogone sp. FLAS-F59071]
MGPSSFTAGIDIQSEAPLRVYKKKNKSQSFYPSESPDFYRPLSKQGPFRLNYNKRVTSEVPPKIPPKVSYDAGSELLRPNASRGRIEGDIFLKSSQTFSSDNVLSVENRETETENKSEYFSAEESDGPILEVTGERSRKGGRTHKTLYTSQLRSQPLPVRHADTKGRTGANVIASRGEDVNRYQSEDPDSNEDRERHRDLDRGRPSIVKSPPLSHDFPPSNRREQSNNKTKLCTTIHTLILYNYFYVGPPHPTGFLWSFKAAAIITDLEGDYTPGGFASIHTATLN